MASYVDKIKPENYQRAFFFKNLGYLVTYLCMAHYGRRDFLAIYDNEITRTYLNNLAFQKNNSHRQSGLDPKICTQSLYD